MDELDAAFRRFGPGWYEGDGGYAGHHYWAPTRADSRFLYGTWKPLLPQPGWYDTLVHVPSGAHATSDRASYRIRTSTGWVTRVRSQRKRQGTWVSLGIHHLTRTPAVQLADRTDEAASLGRNVAFDAARFVPAAGPPPELAQERSHD